MNKNLRLIAVLLSVIFASTAHAQTVATFDDLALPVDSFWNGSDASGGFMNGKAYFYNNYDATYMSWSGFAYSTKKDSLTAGYSNMYSSANGKGYNNTDAYAVAYVSSFGAPTAVSLTAEARGKIVDGFYINNNAYAYQSMLLGDPYTKKFTSKDKDWFMLRVYGYLGGNLTDSTDFYLADFRFADSTKAYIVKDWTWFNLDVLGNVDSLVFGMSSTDNGTYGMNTPAYFCMDDFRSLNGLGFKEVISQNSLQIYPNPVENTLFIKVSNLEVKLLQLFDANGRLIREMENISAQDQMDVSALKQGLYYIRLITEEGVVSKKFIKQ